MHQPRHDCRAFTIIEMVAALVTLIVTAVTALPMLGQARAEARQLKDSTHILGISQACAIWAQQNDERYPTPSRVDITGAVLPRPEELEGRDLRLDTTGNILSLLIFNGYIPPELTVSPAEVGNVEIMSNYQYSNPTTTVKPTEAFWDPAFRGTPLDEWGGKVPGKLGDPNHNSYAQVAYHGARQLMWGNTFSSTQACWGNRGPAYTLDGDAWRPLPGSPLGENSITMLIHGGRETWEGNIGFNDHHVKYLDRPDPDHLMWVFPEINRRLPDNVFHAEHDRTRAPIDEHVELVAGHDGQGVVIGTKVGDGALDQKNNYLRPISKVLPGENGTFEVNFWID